jgi:hypothetical protein
VGNKKPGLFKNARLFQFEQRCIGKKMSVYCLMAFIDKRRQGGQFSAFIAFRLFLNPYETASKINANN